MTKRSLSIAVIEDNADLNAALVDAIRAAGFKADGFPSIEAFEATGTKPQIFLLDLNLPGEDGLGFARRLRAARPSAGIVMLTARNANDQRRNGYESGADIYLTKPSSVDEIIGALTALGRRISPPPLPVADMASDHLLRLSPRKLELSGPSGTVALSAGETALLAHCARDADKRVAFDAFKRIVPDGANLSKVAIELKIVRLRKKLVAAGIDGRSISSVRNYGYQLLVPIRVDHD